MGMSGVAERWGRLAVGAALVSVIVGAPVTARADRGGPGERHEQGERDAARCPRGETPVRIDSRTCPALKRRPSFVVQRACCAHALLKNVGAIPVS